MVKGIPIDHCSSSDFAYIPLHSSDLIFYQDTVKSKTIVSPSVLQVSRPKISADTISLDNQRLERLFQAAEEREIKMAKPKAKKVIEIKEDTTAIIGSTDRIYSDFTPSFQKLPGYSPGNINDNFLLNIAEKTVDLHYKVTDTLKLVSDSSEVNTSSVSLIPKPESAPPHGFQGNMREMDANGWYIFLLILSLSIFAWGKALYQKYLLQIMNSLYNYQISIQLFRDKNALFRNLSIILQVLFPINLGLLIYFLNDFYKINQATENPALSIILYSVIVFLFFRFKVILYKFLGLVFKVQDDFSEIQHHMNTFIQSLGVVLLPFVISLPFLGGELRNIFLIGLYFLTGVFIILFFFRGFQIVSRKQVPIFFLILYLCAVEILPVALIVKTSYLII
jgi:hypothetical protein